MGKQINIIIAILCSFTMFFSVGFLWLKHTKMIMNNQTTIEKKIYSNWKKSLFFVDNKFLCFKSVMGKNLYDFFSLKFYDYYGILMKNQIEILKKNENNKIEIITIDLNNKNNNKKVINKIIYEKLDESY